MSFGPSKAEAFAKAEASRAEAVVRPDDLRPFDKLTVEPSPSGNDKLGVIDKLRPA